MLSSTAYPSLIETSLGCFLHDVGKLLQRAGGSKENLPPEIRSRASDILPSDKGGRHTHIHALWTDLFFERHSRIFPDSINARHVRNVAVYHHKPDSASSEICTQADHLASGMDRKARDENADPILEEPRAWDAFIKTPLDSCFNKVTILGQRAGSRHFVRIGKLDPKQPFPGPTPPDPSSFPAAYRHLTEEYNSEVQHLTELQLSAPAFCDAMQSISERYLSGVPSSTQDQPDISLHDHARAVAAVGAAMHRYHETAGSLEDRPAIRDATTKKFRWVTGDISGIQSSLFRLASQRVRGVNKILRARSFLIGSLLEAVLLETRNALGLPTFSCVQNAGGRFLILSANVPELEGIIDQVRRKIEPWIWRRYLGEVAINIGISEPFSGSDLALVKFRQAYSLASEAADAAKLCSFSTIPDPVHRVEFPHGACSACNARPGTKLMEDEETGEVTYRCLACHDEEHLGRHLPKIAAFGWSREPTGTVDSVEFFGGWQLSWMNDPPRQLRAYESVFQIARPGPMSGGLPVRFLANYVPRKADSAELKTFEDLADAALEPFEGEKLGERLLAVLKADVDRLGLIFSRGIQDPSLGRICGVSRALDFFFAGYLPELLRTSFPDTYTVYAGGDDLLLIGPWRQTIDLAGRLREDFAKYAGSNPSITISAAIELIKENHPLNRAAHLAEDRLSSAKVAGRDRISLIAECPFTWPEFQKQREISEPLTGWLRSGRLSQAFVYRILYFAAERRRAEHEHLLEAANWRSRWGYSLARNIEVKNLENRQIVARLNALLGLDELLNKNKEFVSPEAAVAIAIYRNRSGKEKERNNKP